MIFSKVIRLRTQKVLFSNIINGNYGKTDRSVNQKIVYVLNKNLNDEHKTPTKTARTR